MRAAVPGRRVDHSALRVNQVFTIVSLILAFILNAPWLAAVVAVINLVGALWPPLNVVRRFYELVLRRYRIIRPDVVTDNPEPHRFAQGLGAVFVGLGVLLLYAGVQAGWALAWLVVALASVNLFLRFCVGCFLYYQFNRLGVPGFRYSPVSRS
jgi:hypothetical protein